MGSNKSWDSTGAHSFDPWELGTVPVPSNWGIPLDWSFSLFQYVSLHFLPVRPLPLQLVKGVSLSDRVVPVSQRKSHLGWHIPITGRPVGFLHSINDHFVDVAWETCTENLRAMGKGRKLAWQS